MTTATTTTAKLFVTDYASYNNGDQFEFGHWVDLDQFADADEFNEYLEDHFNKAGIDDPEIMFTDYEGFPAAFYSESYDAGSLEKIFDYIHNEKNIYRQLDEADDADLVNLHNAACRVLGYGDDEIYQFDEEFFEVFFAGKPVEAARATSFGDVNWSDEYIKFDGCGNLQTISKWSVENHIDRSQIIEAYESCPREF